LDFSYFIPWHTHTVKPALKIFPKPGLVWSLRGEKDSEPAAEKASHAECQKKKRGLCARFDGIRPLFRLDFLVLLYQDKRTFK